VLGMKGIRSWTARMRWFRSGWTKMVCSYEDVRRRLIEHYFRRSHRGNGKLHVCRRTWLISCLLII
jgi:hypothetical protein